MTKDIFLDKMEQMYRMSKSGSYRNVKDWATSALERGIITSLEKDELFEFVNYRNSIAHGSFSRINIYQEDLERLDYFKKKMERDLGIKEEVKPVIKEVKKVETKPIIEEAPQKKQEEVKPKIVEVPRQEVRIETIRQEIKLEDLRNGFIAYYVNKLGKKTTDVYNMAFYLTKQNLGLSFEDVVFNKVPINKYAEVLFYHFYPTYGAKTKAVTLLYVDSLKYLQRYLENVHITDAKFI